MTENAATMINQFEEREDGANKPKRPVHLIDGSCKSQSFLDKN